MKRILGILAMVLVIAAGTIATLYLLRKNKALQQYVHPDSQAVLSISVDDLLLDNMGQFFKKHAIDSMPSASGIFDVSDWWRTGIQIPTQIHFFTMKGDPWRFFTIQKIEHPQKWDMFLKEHLTDSINVIPYAGQQLSLAQLSSGVNALYDQQYLLICLAATKQNDDNSILTVWEEKDSWIYVRDLPVAIPENPPAHVTYRHTDGTFELSADITNGHITLAGDWQLTNGIPTTVQRREPVPKDPFIALWSALPLTEMPFITQYLSTFSDINTDKLISNTDGYMDFYIGAGMTTQLDTAIVYDYDEDFNSIEKKEIQEMDVPVIESVWKGRKALATALPEKLFYRFNKNITDSAMLWTTKTEIMFSPTFVTASSPFRLAVDFRHLPASWANGRLRQLQERTLQITIETSRSSEHSLAISGNIHYKEL